jgi:outer membrane protein assembly factor BamB
MIRSMVLPCVLAALLAASAHAAPKRKPAVAKPPWDTRPTLEEIYAGYDPGFAQHNRARMGGHRGQGLSNEMKFSRQKHYMNIADVRIDAQVRPILEKANEIAQEKKEYRRATELYRRILKQYPKDLYLIADQGIFIPAALYAQRKILRYPKKELTYYRILHDPAAKEIYERAIKRYSIFDYKDLVEFHLATSYGDDALFALGNDAVDKGNYDEARRYYERIVTYHGLEDEDRDHVKLDRDQVWVRLAICYKHMNRNRPFQAAASKIRNRNEKTVARLLQQLEEFRYDEFQVRQRETRRSARHDAMDDVKLSESMPYEFPANRGEWEAGLAPRSRLFGGVEHNEPDVFPWATETDLIYKDFNIVYSRSLLTGELNWAFGPGGVSRDWDFYHSGHGGRVYFYPRQSILVHDGVVFAHMFVYGPSLVAVDQNTGRLLWAKGPMAATTEDEWLDRFQCSPAGGRGVVITPVVHDDIRGRSHISSTAELAAYESRSGRLVWRTVVSRISPLKITQSRYPRKIRIFSTTPAIRDNVVYHCTNAGIIAAVDAQTGDIRWLSRYPQMRQVLDNFANPRTYWWRNVPPIVRGRQLFVTPVDCEFVLCLDTETGKILWTAKKDYDSLWCQPRSRPARYAGMWRMEGFTYDGLLALSGRDLAFLDPATGKLAWKMEMAWPASPRSCWQPVSGKKSDQIRKRVPKGLECGINGQGEDMWWPLGQVHCPCRFTRKGKILFSMHQWMTANDLGPAGPFNQDYCVDIKSRSIEYQRRWYSPRTVILGNISRWPVARRVVNEEPEWFDPSMRMVFRRWGIPFEVDVAYNHVVVRYDRKKMQEILAKSRDLNTLFARAEMARKRGDVQGAIRQYEECKPLLPSEEEDRRRNINLRLYPLYTELARWGHESADLPFLEGACKKMGSTASNPDQEIRALLAYAELHAKKGDWQKAVQVLQNASRHYWREPTMVSGIELGDREEILETAGKALENLLGNVPAVYAGTARQMFEAEKTTLPDYFLAVANTDADYVVETRNLIARRLRNLLVGAPKEYREEYETRAGEELKRYESLEVGERLLWCWPESEAAGKKIRELAAKAASLKPVERQSKLWRFADLAAACGLGEKLVPGGESGLLGKPAPTDMPSGSEMQQKEAKNEDPDMVRLALPQKGDVASTAHLLFVGGRKKRAYGNRFTVMCWNMKENRKEWTSREILLHGKVVGGEGYEVGFEEVFIHGNLAIVHGQYDVIALDWTKGTALDHNGKKEKNWHFRVPLGFDIQSINMCGDVLVLCGRGSTVAISPKTGEIIWDAPEMGEFYAGPFFHKDTMLSVRKSPSEVSFRKVGTGRMLCRLRLPGLTTNRRHPMFALEGTGGNPAAAEAAEAYPAAFKEGILAVSDGLTYHVVDVDKRQLRWSKGATKLDLSQDASYRMWIDRGRLFVLKPYYAVLENVVFDLASGDLLWRRREGGKKMDAKLKKYGDADAAGGKAATGLVLSSMAFVDGNVYGIKYEMGASSVNLVGMDPASGNQLMRVSEKGYDDPEAYVEPSWSKGCVAVKIQDGNKFEVWQVDVKSKKIVQKLRLEGYGRLGEYGDASAVWQGPYQAIWAFENRKLTSP